MQPHSSLFESIFKRDIASPGNKEFLEHIAREYPFFAPAQFYLLNNLKDNPEEFNKQAAKTAVLFNNPFWLNYQLEKLAHESQSPLVPQVEQPYDMPAGKEEHLMTDEENSFNNNGHTIIDEEKPSEMIYEKVPEEIQTISSSENENIVEETVQAESEAPRDEQQPIVQSEEKNIEPLLFEPLHTTDYFASQGIKLSDEIQPTDKLGKQLKSFTEWLKTMKKIHVEQQQNNDVQTDQSIQTLAEKSNAEGEIITETMAEVLVQQGRNSKAIEVYHKLSLLNPDKSAYFAARINQLTEI